MAQDTGQIRVAGTGEVYVAPFGTALPADEDDILDAAFLDLGFTSEDGVTFTDGKTVEAIPVWQLFYPARRIVTGREATLVFVLRQWWKGTVEFAFGATITEPAANHFKIEPPEPEEIDDRSMVIDWHDGDTRYRLVVPRGNISDNVETQLVRTAAADLPITFAALGQSAVKPWTMYSNDTALEDVS